MYKFRIFTRTIVSRKFAGTVAGASGKATFAFLFFRLDLGKFMKLGKHALYNLIKNFFFRGADLAGRKSQQATQHTHIGSIRWNRCWSHLSRGGCPKLINAPLRKVTKHKKIFVHVSA